MANKTIYDLTENQTLDADDLFEQDVLQNNERKSLKVTLRAIADKIVSSLTYSSLNTTSKTVVGAINELEQGGGGGGTGGHTIIDENGTSMTARAGLQFVGGANVSDDATNNKTIVDLASAGGIDGVFIDTSNVIQASTTLTANSTTNYTATEDCVIRTQLWTGGNGKSSSVSIDGLELNTILSSSGSMAYYFTFLLKKGQVATFEVTGQSAYTVYGIQTGTSHSKFQPVIYSLEEREIGVWTDGKPLYEKTIPIQALQSSAGQTSYPHSISNIEHIIDYVATINFNNANGTYARFDRVGTAGNSLDFGNTFSISVDKTNINIIVGKDRSACSANVTVRYTKTTDVAGSGSWTPQGVPTHHYSTDEQVIGTWIDGKTLYEKTYTGLNVSIVNANTWYDTDLSASGIDTFVGGNLIDINKQSYPVNVAFMSSNTKIGISCGMANRTGVTLTIQYTKSS